MNYLLSEEYLFCYNLGEKLAANITSAEREHLSFYFLRLLPTVLELPFPHLPYEASKK